MGFAADVRREFPDLPRATHRGALLYMHHDGDDVVLWTHGLELLMAMRRLGKELYLINYPGERHSLNRRANKLDWDRRSQVFFDQNGAARVNG